MDSRSHGFSVVQGVVDRIRCSISFHLRSWAGSGKAGSAGLSGRRGAAARGAPVGRRLLDSSKSAVIVSVSVSG